MTKLTFKSSDNLDKIVFHALKNNQPVMFVKDQGIYLMAFGLKKNQTTAVQCFADGFDPDINEDDWWGAASKAVGGDDFGEELGPRRFMGWEPGFSITIDVFPTTLKIVVIEPQEVK